MTRSVEEIDALLAAEKALFGSPEWTEEGSVARLTSAVVNASGVVIGGLSFRASVLIETSVQRGSAALVLDGSPVQRLSFRPDHPHVNKAAHPVPAHLRLKVVEPDPVSFMAAMELFLEACGIVAYAPAPPHRPTLELR